MSQAVTPQKLNPKWGYSPALVARVDAIFNYIVTGGTKTGASKHFSISIDEVSELLDAALSMYTVRPDQESMSKYRAESVARFRRIQTVSWEKISMLNEDANNLPKLLNVIISAEREVTKLQGTAAPLQQQLQISNDPLQVVFDASVDPSQIPEHLRRAVMGHKYTEPKQLHIDAAKIEIE